jgi:DNA-binding MarR family transcriptional regulator
MPINNNTLEEREFELINIVGMRITSNQRDLSKHMELSLGMTNMLLRRLVEKGFIRIRQLNKKKVEYLLTPKGFAEKMRKSVKYTLKTINSIGLIKDRLQTVVRKLYDQGERRFFILGRSDLVGLAAVAFQEGDFSECAMTTIKELPAGHIDGVVLICTEKFDKTQLNSTKHINLIEELAKDQVFVNFANGRTEKSLSQGVAHAQ